MLLYIWREIGTYTGHVDPCLGDHSANADRLSRAMGAGGWPARRSDAGAAAPAQAAGVGRPVAAGADVACDAGHWDVGGAPVSVVSRATGRQFLVGSQVAAALA